MMLDFTKDNAPHFVKAASSIMPDIAAKIGDFRDVSQLHANAFADTTLRLHPIHTKEAAVLSAAYVALMDVPAAAHIRNRIKTACVEFGAGDYYDALVTEEVTKSAAADEPADEAFALVVKDGAVTHRHYPIDSSNAVQDSAFELVNDYYSRHKFPVSWFREAATNLMKAAAIHDVKSYELPEDVVRVGNDDTLPDFEKAASYAKMRVAAGAPSDAVEIYSELVKYAQEHPDELEDVMDSVEDLDRNFGIRYGGVVPNPSDMFYCGNSNSEIEKAADAHVMVCDILVPVEEVTGRYEEKALRRTLGKSQMDKLAEVVKHASEGKGREASAVVAALPVEVQQEFMTHLLHNAVAA